VMTRTRRENGRVLREMLETVHRCIRQRNLSDALTWGVICGLATIAVGLLFWMGAASNSGRPISTVAGIGLGSLLASGVAAWVAVRFSRRPD